MAESVAHRIVETIAAAATPDDAFALIDEFSSCLRQIRLRLVAQLPPNDTLATLLERIRARDNALESDDFDPAAALTDRHALEGKVDGYAMVEKELEKHAKALRGDAAAIAERAQKVERKHDRLRKRIAELMRGPTDDPALRFERLPGDRWAIRLYDSPWSIRMQGPPSASDFARHPGLVEMERSYRWRTDVIKEALISGEIPPTSMPQAHLSRGVHVKFEPNAPALLQAAPRKKRTKRNGDSTHDLSASSAADRDAVAPTEPDDDLKGVF